MPKQTFFNLPDEKKERLMAAAYEEFSRVPLEEASINAIVQQSGIARGSFYQYFEGKEDLFFYRLSLLKKDLEGEMVACYHEEQGDLVRGTERLFRMLYQHYVNGEHARFYYHFFVNMSYRKNTNMTNPSASNHHSQHHQMLESIRGELNRDTLKFESEEELDQFLQYLLQMIHWTLAKACLQQLSEEHSFQIIHQRLSWMAHGVVLQNKGGQLLND